MERGRQSNGANLRCPSTGFKKGEPVVPTNFVGNPGAAVKLDQVCATTQQDVLAIVHHLARARMLIRGCPATKIGAPLKQCHAEAGIGERAGRSQASQTAAYDRYRGGLRWL